MRTTPRLNSAKILWILSGSRTSRWILHFRRSLYCTVWLYCMEYDYGGENSILHTKAPPAHTFQRRAIFNVHHRTETQIHMIVGVYGGCAFHDTNRIFAATTTTASHLPQPRRPLRSPSPSLSVALSVVALSLFYFSLRLPIPLSCLCLLDPHLLKRIALFSSSMPIFLSSNVWKPTRRVI